MSRAEITPKVVEDQAISQFKPVLPLASPEEARQGWEAFEDD